MARHRLVRVTPIAVAAALAAAAILLAVTGFAGALSFVIRAAGIGGSIRHIAEAAAAAEGERVVRIPAASGSMRARVYAPSSSRSRQTVLLVSGLHPAGIDEPRLIAFSRELAKSGVTVVTPEVPGLADLTITPALTKGFERAATWLATESGLTRDRRIGLIGISFSGGLVVAGRPSMRGHVSYVLSIGGHDDLPRVLHYICTGIEEQRGPPGASPRNEVAGRSPHVYAQAVVLLNMADRLVPAGQVRGLRKAIHRFVRALSLEQFDKAAAAQAIAAVAADADDMPEPSRELLRYMIARDVARLGARLLPYISEYGNAADLSPARSPKPAAPVFLLHGRDDNIIPAAESLMLADELRAHTRVRLLVTDLLSHAMVDRPARIRDSLRLVDFWRDLFAQGSQSIG